MIFIIKKIQKNLKQTCSLILYQFKFLLISFIYFLVKKKVVDNLVFYFNLMICFYVFFWYKKEGVSMYFQVVVRKNIESSLNDGVSMYF